ncbi:hypothetical protein JCM19239_168 [Vibrio variabilis]|uniref:Uncharacterized protein n=1 Tax=Vibrio variabilis TaxID=990271 RepID=A0ABQ0JD46_9VIBR|nr:hypothetical protein JCM19239_168 [Vibrio variabilis]
MIGKSYVDCSDEAAADYKKRHSLSAVYKLDAPVAGLGD